MHDIKIKLLFVDTFVVSFTSTGHGTRERELGSFRVGGWGLPVAAVEQRRPLILRERVLLVCARGRI